MNDNSIIQAVLGRIIAQQEKGLAKYGKLVQVDSHSTDEWIEHLMQELSDALIYLECVKSKSEELQRYREALGRISGATMSMYLDFGHMAVSLKKIARDALYPAKEQNT